MWRGDPLYTCMWYREAEAPHGNALCHIVKCGTRVVFLDAPIGIRRSLYAMAGDRDVLWSGIVARLGATACVRLSSTVAAAVNWAEEMEMVNNVDTVTYYICSPAMVCMPC